MPSSVPASGAIDLGGAAFVENPYPVYARLRAEHPVYRHPQLGFFLLTRYADVHAAARNPELFSSAMGIGPLARDGQTMVSKDPPDHTRLRRLVNKAFTAEVVEGMRERVRLIAHGLVDEAIARGEFDLVRDFGEALPTIVIAEMLGIDPELRRDFRRWSNGLVDFVGRPRSPGAMAAYARSLSEFHSYITKVIEQRRREPKDDLVSLLVQAHEDRDALTDREVFFTCQLLLTAGNETVTNMTGNIGLTLASHPEQARRVLAEPALIPPMIEEVARYESPVQVLFRTTTREAVLHGVTIPARSKAGLVWGAANRDPEVFAEPDRFDVSRSPNPHLAFGTGIHFCLGTALARLQLRVATEVLCERFGTLAFAPGQSFERRQGFMLRGLTRFPVRIAKS